MTNFLLNWWVDTHLFTDWEVGEFFQLTCRLVDWQKDTHWVGGRGRDCSTHSITDWEVGAHYQLTYTLVDSRKDTHWEGGRCRMAALIYQQRSSWALSIKLTSGWLRKVHILGRVTARWLVALTPLMTEK